MSTKSSLLLAFVVLAGFSVLSFSASEAQDQEAQPKPEMRWEYLERINPSVADLNAYGKEGWELVTVARRPGDQTNSLLYFKRPLQPPIVINELDEETSDN